MTEKTLKSKKWTRRCREASIVLIVHLHVSLISENLQAVRLAIGRRVKRARDLSVGVWYGGRASRARRAASDGRGKKRENFVEARVICDYVPR